LCGTGKGHQGGLRKSFVNRRTLDISGGKLYPAKRQRYSAGVLEHWQALPWAKSLSLRSLDDQYQIGRRNHAKSQRNNDG